MATGTMIRRVLLQIKADDGDTEAKLDKISLKADELAGKHPDLKVRIDTAAASAKVAVLRAELRDLSRQADEEAAKGGIMSRFLGGFGKGFGGIFGNIPFLGGIGGGGGSGSAGGAGAAGEGAPALSGIGAGGAVAIGVALPVLGALLAEVDGLVSGFAAAGAGAGAFALLAGPAFKKVSSAYTAINKDQQAYDNALTKTARNTALKKLQQDYAALDPTERKAVAGVQQLVGEWHKISSAFEPEAYKVFSDFLQLANTLLPDITPFAKTFADSMHGLLQQADRFAGSKGFKDWLGQFHALEGPALHAIGEGVGHVVTSIGKLLTIMSGKDVANAINIAFSIIDGAIIGLAGAIRITMKVWDWMTTTFKTSRHDIANTFDGIRHSIAGFGHGTASTFDTVRHGAATAAHDTAHSFDVMRHGIAAAVDGTLNWVKAHWKEIVAWLADPVGMAVFEIKTHTHQIAKAFDEARHTVSSILAGMRHDTAAAFDGIRHSIASFADWLPHAIASAFSQSRHNAAASAAGARHDVASAWDGLRHDTAAMTDSVIRFFGRLPGEILHAIAALPGEMLSAGENIISGLLHGLESGAAQIPGIMKSIAGNVVSFFTNPLKIFSPSRVMFDKARMVPEGVALGLEAGTPRIRQAAGKMAQTVRGTQLGAPALSGAGGYGGRLQIEFTGGANDPLWVLFRKNIRVRGGNVNVVGR